MWMVSGPPPKTTNQIVLACAPNEWHEGSLLILGGVIFLRLYEGRQTAMERAPTA